MEHDSILSKRKVVSFSASTTEDEYASSPDILSAKVNSATLFESAVFKLPSPTISSGNKLLLEQSDAVCIHSLDSNSNLKLISSKKPALKNIEWQTQKVIFYGTKLGLVLAEKQGNAPGKGQLENIIYVAAIDEMLLTVRQRASVSPGDLIVAIGENNILGHSLFQFQNLLSNSPRPVTLSFSREAKILASPKKSTESNEISEMNSPCISFRPSQPELYHVDHEDALSQLVHLSEKASQQSHALSQALDVPESQNKSTLAVLSTDSLPRILTQYQQKNDGHANQSSMPVQLYTEISPKQNPGPLKTPRKSLFNQNSSNLHRMHFCSTSRKVVKNVTAEQVKHILSKLEDPVTELSFFKTFTIDNLTSILKYYGHNLPGKLKRKEHLAHLAYSLYINGKLKEVLGRDSHSMPDNIPDRGETKTCSYPSSMNEKLNTATSRDIGTYFPVIKRMEEKENSITGMFALSTESDSDNWECTSERGNGFNSSSSDNWSSCSSPKTVTGQEKVLWGLRLPLTNEDHLANQKPHAGPLLTLLKNIASKFQSN